MSAAGWRQQADLLAAQGHYREALRCRYRALVADLAGSGMFDEVPGRTSGDYERLVGEAVPEVSSRFSGLTRPIASRSAAAEAASQEGWAG